MTLYLLNRIGYVRSGEARAILVRGNSEADARAAAAEIRLTNDPFGLL